MCTELLDATEELAEAAEVSIPFKRESTCALEGRPIEVNIWCQGFNSLQTGKHMCTSMEYLNHKKHEDRFNSLQTGKHMCTVNVQRKQSGAASSFNSLQTGKHMCTKKVEFNVGYNLVSIPFKRESTCARDLATEFRNDKVRFNSLQTGKHMCTRPSNGVTLEQLMKMFQFPSNGKAHVHLPYFRPPPRLTPEPLIQTRTARGFFLLKNWSENRLNPYEY